MLKKETFTRIKNLYEKYGDQILIGIGRRQLEKEVMERMREQIAMTQSYSSYKKQVELEEAYDYAFK